jgi:hypothetical protein
LALDPEPGGMADKKPAKKDKIRNQPIDDRYI